MQTNIDTYNYTDKMKIVMESGIEYPRVIIEIENEEKEWQPFRHRH